MVLVPFISSLAITDVAPSVPVSVTKFVTALCVYYSITVYRDSYRFARFSPMHKNMML